MENNNHCVYIHTNKINRKKYVGRTKHGDNPEKRWGKNGERYEGCFHFYSAIRLYRWKNFEHEIIKSGLTEEEAKQLEKETIEKFDTTNPLKGYNILKDSVYKPTGEKVIMQFSTKGKCLDNYYYQEEDIEKDIPSESIEWVKWCLENEESMIDLVENDICKLHKMRRKMNGRFLWKIMVVKVYWLDDDEEVSDAIKTGTYKESIAKKMEEFEKWKKVRGIVRENKFLRNEIKKH